MKAKTYLKRIFLATLLVSVAPALAAQTADKEIVVFDNANSEVPYRIPALAYTRAGKLLAVCDYRLNKADIGINNHNGLSQIHAHQP